MEAAARDLRAALDLAPNHPAALNTLGMMALNGGDPGGAVDLFARAADADPRAAPLLMNLASAHRALGDDDGERRALDRVVALDQRDLGAQIRKAQLHQRRAEHAEATLAWRAALLFAPPLEQRAPELDALLRDAAAYVAERDRDFVSTVDARLDRERAAFDGAELRRFDAAVDVALGRRRVYQPVCHGVHFPFLPADEFFPRHLFPWMDALEARADAIREEISALLAEAAPGFVPYISMPSGAPPTIWSELDNNLQWTAYHLWRHGERQDDACARCPATAAALNAISARPEIPGRTPNAFFSLLRPRTRIPPHNGVTNTRVTVHLPLIVPDGCAIRVGGETRGWTVGEALAFDDTIEHEAWNDSDELRVVLIFDAWNPHLSPAERALLRLFYETADASGHNPEAQRGM